MAKAMVPVVQKFDTDEESCPGQRIFQRQSGNAIRPHIRPDANDQQARERADGQLAGNDTESAYCLPPRIGSAAQRDGECLPQGDDKQERQSDQNHPVRAHGSYCGTKTASPLRVVPRGPVTLPVTPYAPPGNSRSVAVPEVV